MFDRKEAPVWLKRAEMQTTAVEKTPSLTIKTPKTSKQL